MTDMTHEQGNRDVIETYRPLFRPRSIAVIGASSSGVTPGNEFIRHSRNYGYDGAIYPIHPKAERIEDLPVYRSLADIGEPVDYAYIAVGAQSVPEILAEAHGRLRFAQVMSSGFGEVDSGKELERRLVEIAREAGVRVLGPNCLGVHSPHGGITFVGGAEREPGPVGIVSQSGGLGVDIIRRGQGRGLRFSSVVTIGNSADVEPSDMLEYHLADPDTGVVGMYIEDVKDGRRFFELLRDARARKPVVLLVGGRTQQGQRAAVSHTGSLAADARLWDGLARQTGAVLVDTLEEFLDVLLAFQTLSPRPERPTDNVVLFGNGGGTSVLAADFFARHDLVVPPLQGEARAELDALNLPPGTSVANPIDTPAGTLRVEDGRVAERILEIIHARGRPDAVVMHINLPVFLTATDQRVDVVGNLMQAAQRVRERFPGQAHFLLVLRSDGSAEADERKRADRARAVREGIPVYDELPAAAATLQAVRRYERFRHAREHE